MRMRRPPLSDTLPIEIPMLKKRPTSLFDQLKVKTSVRNSVNSITGLIRIGQTQYEADGKTRVQA